MLQKIIVVVGPTACGKTALALALAREFDGVLISVDSRQVYRGMDIGTNKGVIKKQGDTLLLNDIPLHGVDLKNPNESYSAAEYQQYVFHMLPRLTPHLPILVGGTGLYISAVVDNLLFPAVAPDKTLRASLEQELKTRGLEHLAQKLAHRDPASADTVDMKNPRRVIRALEVALATGNSFAKQKKRGEPRVHALLLAPAYSRTELKKNIEQRTDAMLAEGLIEETKKIVARYGASAPALTGIGYQEIMQHLNGELSLQEARALIATRTMQFAKRQETWFKRDARIHVVKNVKEAKPLVRAFLA